MRVVAALGGNALLRRGEPMCMETQQRNVAAAVEALAAIAGGDRHELVITHGNGPQVGLLALQAEGEPLDVLGAESEGMIGYLIESALRERLPGREVATLLTQVVVDPADPAFAAPTKPIGPVYARADAERLAVERGFVVVPEPGGRGFRRVVPSPEPERILELATIRLLLEADVLVVCTGGGGVPVVPTGAGGLRGVEAVIDKDKASALLARELGADALLLLTDIDAVYEEWGEQPKRPLRRATPAALRNMRLDPGSMGPKAEAACRFVECGRRAATAPARRFAGIGRLEDATAILAGEAGTRVEAEGARQ